MVTGGGNTSDVLDPNGLDVVMRSLPPANNASSSAGLTGTVTSTSAVAGERPGIGLDISNASHGQHLIQGRQTAVDILPSRHLILVPS